MSYCDLVPGVFNSYHRLAESAVCGCAGNVSAAFFCIFLNRLDNIELAIRPWSCAPICNSKSNMRLSIKRVTTSSSKDKK